MWVASSDPLVWVLANTPTSVATTPIVQSHLHDSMSVIDRPAQVTASDRDVPVSAL